MIPAHGGVASATPISLSEHGQQGWKRPVNYDFARHIALEPLAVGEISRVAQTIPVAFLGRCGGWEPVAVMGPVPGTNLFVDRSGQWRGGFVPGGLRVYPFCRLPESGELGLWRGYDTHSLRDPEALPFYSENELTVELKSVLGFLERRAEEIAKARGVATWLAANDVLSPWRIPGVERSDESGEITGLYRVDFERLHQLKDIPLLTLLRAGHLQWLYAHLASLEHAKGFKTLAEGIVRPPKHNRPNTERSNKSTGILSAMAQDLGDAEL